MKKKKIGILASALMVCAVCASLIAGSTFALFTSNDSVNIAITSGKVAVTATVGEPTVSVIEGSGMTTPNVEAKTVGNSVTLSNITPGDKVDFDIAIDNSQTTTKAKYRISYKVENGYLLASGLDIVVGEFTDGTAKYQSYSSAWTEDIAKTVKVSIAMPVDAGNLYQGLSTAISFSVEAIQANAVTSEAPVVSYFPDNTDAVVAAENNNLVVLEKGASLADALKDSKDKYIVLTEDTVFASASELNNVTIDANGNELYKTTSGIKGLSGTAVTLKNAVFNPGSNNDWGISTRGVSYYNCVFNGYSPYYSTGSNVNVLDDIVVDGCTFNNTTLQICYNEHTGLLPKNTVITNNVFNVNNTNANVHAIVLGGGEKEQWEDTVAPEDRKNIVIKGNTFNPVYADKSYVAYYVYGQYGVTLDSVKTFPDNTYNGLAMYSVNDITNQYDIKTGTLTITSAAALANFAAAVNAGNSYAGKTVVLGADINLADVAWTPIGATGAPFEGVFDGKGYVVSNLHMDLPEEKFVGLFGYIKSPAKLQNVNIHNATVTGCAQVGALVGDGYTGTVANCHVTGKVEVTGNYQTGGLMGYGYASVNDCSVIADEGSFVKGVYLENDLEGDAIGGLVGYMCEVNGTFANLKVSGLTVIGTRKVGGLVGQLGTYDRTLENVTVENVVVSINATAEYINGNTGKIMAGGILGECTSGTSVTVKGTASNIVVNGVAETTTGALAGGTRGGVQINVSAVVAENNTVNIVA